MPPSQLTRLPLPAGDDAALGGRTNLYLGERLKVAGAAAARERYGWSLSHLVRSLLERETTLKGGLIHAQLRKPSRSRAHGC